MITRTRLLLRYTYIVLFQTGVHGPRMLVTTLKDSKASKHVSILYQL